MRRIDAILRYRQKWLCPREAEKSSGRRCTCRIGQGDPCRHRRSSRQCYNEPHVTSTKVEIHCALCLSIGCGCGSSPRREGGRRCSLQPCGSISCRLPCSPLRLAGWSPSSGGEERGGWRAGAERPLDVASIEPLIAFVTTRGSSQPICVTESRYF